ncbi:WD40 repeat domain-containing protein [Dactylosporangium sp. NPDC000521]|uniref:WD40 repeat domain-containing protein n=1 Tax=Dactylosporangium sp. NPDC000521 TaxID=3363975 RepID=UPI00369EB08D
MPVAGATLLASVSTDGGIRLWDPRTWQLVRVLAGARGALQAVCAVRAGDRVLVATAGQDGHGHGWDAETGEHPHALAGLGHPVYAVCRVEVGGRTMLASAGCGCGTRCPGSRPAS